MNQSEWIVTRGMVHTSMHAWKIEAAVYEWTCPSIHGIYGPSRLRRVPDLSLMMHRASQCTYDELSHASLTHALCARAVHIYTTHTRTCLQLVDPMRTYVREARIELRSLWTICVLLLVVSITQMFYSTMLLLHKSSPSAVRWGEKQSDAPRRPRLTRPTTRARCNRHPDITKTSY